MKKTKNLLISASLTLLVITGVAGCGMLKLVDKTTSSHSSTSSNETDNRSTTEYNDVTTSNEYASTTAPTEAETTSPYTDEDFLWQTYYDESVDFNTGYKILKTIKVSGWMKSDDTERINAAWKSIEKKKIFSATPSEMGFHNGKIYLNSNSGTYFWIHDWDEVVYAVGYLKLENTTENYSITSSNTYSPYVNFGTLNYETSNSLALNFGNNSPASIKIYTSTPKVIYANQSGGYYSYIHPKMTSDRWGVPFILAFPIDNTPNAPDGDPYPGNCLFCFEGQQFCLPLTWE